MERSRSHRFDLLRAISICLLLWWHLQPIQLRPDSSWFASFVTWFNEQITLIAVPLFLCVSLLSFLEQKPESSQVLKEHLSKIAIPLIVWSGLQTIFYGVTHALNLWLPGQERISLKSIFIAFWMGGPPILGAGDSPLYVLVVLLILLSLMLLLNKLSLKLSTKLCLAVIVISLLYFEVSGLMATPLPYWRIDNFLIYGAIAYLLKHYAAMIKNQRKWITISFLLFQIHDIWLKQLGWNIFTNLGIYSRISIVLEVLLILITVNEKRWFSEHSALKFLSIYFLGILVLHKYFQTFSTWIVNSWLLPSGALEIRMPASNGMLNLNALGIAAIALILTLMTAWLISRTRLKPLISEV